MQTCYVVINDVSNRYASADHPQINVNPPPHIFEVKIRIGMSGIIPNKNYKRKWKKIVLYRFFFQYKYVEGFYFQIKLVSFPLLDNYRRSYMYVCGYI